jgi:hypothetical protein
LLVGHLQILRALGAAAIARPLPGIERAINLRRYRKQRARKGSELVTLLQCRSEGSATGTVHVAQNNGKTPIDRMCIVVTRGVTPDNATIIAESHGTRLTAEGSRGYFSFDGTDRGDHRAPGAGAVNPLDALRFLLGGVVSPSLDLVTQWRMPSRRT